MNATKYNVDKQTSNKSTIYIHLFDFVGEKTGMKLMYPKNEREF